MNNTCPNCGAPIDVRHNKCSYCGTSYFDLTSIDFTGNKPVYFKIKYDTYVNGKLTPVYITQKAIPRLNEMSVGYDTVDYYGGLGNNKVMSYCTRKYCTTDISFEGIANEDGTLYKMEIEE